MGRIRDKVRLRVKGDHNARMASDRKLAKTPAVTLTPEEIEALIRSKGRRSR